MISGSASNQEETEVGSRVDVAELRLVERLHFQTNPVDLRSGVTFADPALHYTEHELVGRSESIHPKAHTAIKGYEAVNEQVEMDINGYSLGTLGNRTALMFPIVSFLWSTSCGQPYPCYQGH